VSHGADVSAVTRGKDSTLLDRADIPARVHVPADPHLRSPARGSCRALRLPRSAPGRTRPTRAPLVATHSAPVRNNKKRQVGRIRDGVVSERFRSTLPQSAFTASDVVSLSLHRGSGETAREDEDLEHEPDRWWSHAAWGPEAWPIVAPWTGNLRRKLGPQRSPELVRTPEGAPAPPSQHEHAPAPPASSAASMPASGSAPPVTATFWNVCAGVQQAMSWSRMSGVEKARAASGSSLPPAFMTAARVQNVSTAHGRGARRPHRARSVCCSIPSSSALLRCGFAGLAPTAPAAGESPSASPTPGGLEGTGSPQNLCLFPSDALSGPACAFPLVRRRAAGSPRPSRTS
jgi:hypothetical protein